LRPWAIPRNKCGDGFDGMRHRAPNSIPFRTCSIRDQSVARAVGATILQKPLKVFDHDRNLRYHRGAIRVMVTEPNLLAPAPTLFDRLIGSAPRVAETHSWLHHRIRNDDC